MKRKPTHASWIWTALAAAPLALATPSPAQDRAPESPWPDRAEAGQRAVRQLFWNEDTGLYEHSFPAREVPDPLMYWWQAHTIDTLVDGFERSGEQRYLDQASALWDSVKRHGGGPTNLYYDDMEWMALALLRLQAHTQDTVQRDDIDTLWEDIKGGWNDEQGGGIAWRKTQPDYKNTPANAPAVILGARLYQRSGDAEHLAWARKIYTWHTAHLVDPDTGFTWDGVNRRGHGRTDKDWAFTYNQGVRIGAAVEMYNATGERAYLDDAERTYAATLDRMADDGGIIREGGNADKGLFKGIFFRYIAHWAETVPDAREAKRSLIDRHAEALWEHTGRGEPLRFPSDWTSSELHDPLDLSVQLSAVMVLELTARLAEPSAPPGE